MDLNSNLDSILNPHAVPMGYGGGVFYETKIGNQVELSLSGTPLLYQIPSNVYVTDDRLLKYPPTSEQQFLAYGSDEKTYRLRILTGGGIYSPHDIPSNVILTGYIRYYAN